MICINIYFINKNRSNIANLPINFSFAGINIVTPYRVLPGKLSVFNIIFCIVTLIIRLFTFFYHNIIEVSRTIGDKEAKLTKFGGNPNVVISDPDIIV